MPENVQHMGHSLHCGGHGPGPSPNGAWRSSNPALTVSGRAGSCSSTIRPLILRASPRLHHLAPTSGSSAPYQRGMGIHSGQVKFQTGCVQLFRELQRHPVQHRHAGGGRKPSESLLLGRSVRLLTGQIHGNTASIQNIGGQVTPEGNQLGEGAAPVLLLTLSCMGLLWALSAQVETLSTRARFFSVVPRRPKPKFSITCCLSA